MRSIRALGTEAISSPRQTLLLSRRLIFHAFFFIVTLPVYVAIEYEIKKDEQNQKQRQQQQKTGNDAIAFNLCFCCYCCFFANKNKHELNELKRRNKKQQQQ